MIFFKKILYLLCIVNSSLFAFELQNFSQNNIDYQWDRKDKQEEALSVYVTGFQYTYRLLGLGDCAEHFAHQRMEEKALAEKNPMNNHWLVALEGEQVIGIAIFELDHFPNVYIRELSVLPEYRRRGIGRELTFGILRNNAVDRIAIVTRRVNQPAIDFYKSLNFQESNYQHAGYDTEKYIGMEWTSHQTGQNIIPNTKR